MNDGMRCREGLEITSFPADLPIYSGHFHKPHTMIFKHKTGAMVKSKDLAKETNLTATAALKGDVKSTTLRYVGSPYQTSLSEAGQEKYLYCMKVDISVGLEAAKWMEEERWCIDIGKKYIKVQKIIHHSLG